jgi:LPXTG-motif cell wall-anchored protein
MGLVNKRNAVIGWTVLKVGKRVAKKKARGAVPGRVDDSMRPNTSAIATGLATLGGVFWFLRRRRSDTTPS